MAYLGGDREKGLELIARSVREGFFIPPNHDYLQLLYEDPGFAPVLQEQQEIQAREREQFLNVVCNDNPYVEIWQPAEGTCEQYLAAD